MLLHAGAGAGIQRDPSGGNCCGAGNYDAGLWAAHQCDGECAACGGSADIEFERDHAVGHAGGVRKVRQDEPGGSEVLFGVRKHTLIPGTKLLHSIVDRSMSTRLLFCLKRIVASRSDGKDAGKIDLSGGDVDEEGWT